MVAVEFKTGSRGVLARGGSNDSTRFGVFASWLLLFTQARRSLKCSVTACDRPTEGGCPMFREPIVLYYFDQVFMGCDL